MLIIATYFEYLQIQCSCVETKEGSFEEPMKYAFKISWLSIYTSH